MKYVLLFRFDPEIKKPSQQHALNPVWRLATNIHEISCMKCCS